MIQKHVLEICCGKDKYVYKEDEAAVKKKYDDISRGIQKGEKLYEFLGSETSTMIVLPQVTMLKISRGIKRIY